MEQDTFEVSLRILGNEVVGMKVSVDDFKVKWLLWSLVAVATLAGIATYFDMV